VTIMPSAIDGRVVATGPVSTARFGYELHRLHAGGPAARADILGDSGLHRLGRLIAGRPAEIKLRVQRRLLHERQQEDRPAQIGVGDPSRREAALGGVVGMHRQPDLLEIVAAGHPAGRFPGRLDRRQQEADQEADDRDHDEQFDKRQAWPAPPAEAAFPSSKLIDHEFSLTVKPGRGRRSTTRQGKVPRGDGTSRRSVTLGEEAREHRAAGNVAPPAAIPLR